MSSEAVVEAASGAIGSILALIATYPLKVGTLILVHAEVGCPDNEVSKMHKPTSCCADHLHHASPQYFKRWKCSLVYAGHNLQISLERAVCRVSELVSVDSK
jgi:hypothetical protein